jgi:GAF domain-containing protein
MSLLDITIASLPTVVTTAVTVANVRLKRTARAEVKEKASLLRLLQRATAAGNRSPSFAAASRSVLDDVCELTGWPVAHVYVCDEGADELVSAGVWRLPRGARFKRLSSVTEGTSTGGVDGAADRAFSSRQPAWISDISTCPNVARYRAAGAAGLKGALAFPVLVGYEVAAVIEFFSDRAVEPGEELLHVMTDVGAQVGRMLERDWAGEDLDDRERELVALRRGLEDTRRSLRESEEQLRASEQQLRASEEQLRASEEQLRESEEQLREKAALARVEPVTPVEPVGPVADSGRDDGQLASSLSAYRVVWQTLQRVTTAVASAPAGGPVGVNGSSGAADSSAPTSSPSD